MELFTPEFGLVFWMFVVFVILFAILAKFAWPYIIRSLDERAELIDKGVEYAQEAKAQLDNAQADAKALLVEAQKQQMEILHEAAQMKTHIIEEARQAASGRGEESNGRCGRVDRASSKRVGTSIPPRGKRVCPANCRKNDA